jgi:hypothetical protein
VTRIELQAVGGIVLAVLGLGYDDYQPVTGTTTFCAFSRGLSLDIDFNLPEGASITDVVSATYGTGTGTSCENFAFGTCQRDVTAEVRRLLDAEETDVNGGLDDLADRLEDWDAEDILRFLRSVDDPCPGSTKSLQIVVSYTMPGNLVTQDLVDVLTFTTGIEGNDAAFQTQFPFEQKPWSGFDDGAMLGGQGSPVINTNAIAPNASSAGMKLAPPAVAVQQVANYPNPARLTTTFRYRVTTPSEVSMSIFNAAGNLVATPLQKQPRQAGVYELSVDVSKLDGGIYYARVLSGGMMHTLKFVVTK